MDSRLHLSNIAGVAIVCGDCLCRNFMFLLIHFCSINVALIASEPKLGKHIRYSKMLGRVCFYMCILIYVTDSLKVI